MTVIVCYQTMCPCSAPFLVYRDVILFLGGGWWALASNARLYFEDDYDNKRIGSWCAVDRNPQWLKIDLGQMKTITGIATQGL